jgi:N-acetylmuramoyl-L-alanine amidase
MRTRASAERWLVVCVVVLLLVPSVFAEDAEHALYVAALAHERTVRAAMNGAADSQVVLKEIRAVVTEFQGVVRRYPASGYSDNALWQAGRLELDSYAWFGDAADRDAGVRLLKRLAADYPASSLVRQVPAALAAAAHTAAQPKIPAVALTRSSSTTATASTASTGATLRGITRTVLPDVVRIVIDVDSEVSFHDERVADPDQLVIDLARTQTAPLLSERTIRFSSDFDIVRQARFAAPRARTSRLVLDATGVSTYNIYALYNPYRLVVDCVRGPSPVQRRALASRTLLTAWARRLPTVTPRESALLHDVMASVPVVATAAADPHPGGFSMARQLGLGVSRIVIDPGHGGHDPGATGKDITEAELVLDVALRLETMLRKLPGMEVVLTRRTDDFVALQERTAIANREGADLFLSIHANASESGDVRGIETYFLNFANNLSAAGVAARENAASGQAMAALPDFVKAIALNNKLDESRELATCVQRSMMERLRPANKLAKDLGVKQAPFVVLIGAAMPSVLAEVSFVTNPQEAKLLRGPAYRQRIADALFAAIRKYQTSLRNVGTVATK